MLKSTVNRLLGRETTEQEKSKQGRAEGAKRTTRETIIEYTKAIGSAVLIALVLRQFLFQAFRIPTGSMLETLQIGDFLFVNKFLYGAKTPDRIRIGSTTLIDGLPVLKLPALREPRQGDIIVFEFPQDRNTDYIKRCVAVAGDTVAVRDGVLHVNGLVYESNLGDFGGDHSCIPTWTDPESCPQPRAKHDQAAYVRNPRMRSWPWDGMIDPYVVPEGHIFMMGDNRYNSMDSRYWGPLDTDLIRGKAMFIYWSWNGKKHLPRLNRIGDLIK
ncbi:MAG: signal peptidase I [bacterium]|nr:signal peptidase I [bacterium]